MFSVPIQFPKTFYAIWLQPNTFHACYCYSCLLFPCYSRLIDCVYDWLIVYSNAWLIDYCRCRWASGRPLFYLILFVFIYVSNNSSWILCFILLSVSKKYKLVGWKRVNERSCYHSDYDNESILFGHYFNCSADSVKLWNTNAIAHLHRDP